MSAWDRRSDKQLHAVQDELVRAQVRAVAAAAPYWRQRFADLGRTASSVDGVAGLTTVPAAGERDVSPHGDPAAMAGLVLHGGERQFTLHASGPTLRRALRLRVSARADYRRVVDAETQPTSYLWAGLGFRYPVASTRGDLDVVARAGARLWNVLGLSSNDALLSAVPVASTVEHTALQYAALAAGAPALFPGEAPEALVAAARLAPPTVVAAPAATAADVVAALAAAGGLARLTTVVLVGAPADAERTAAQDAVQAAGVAGAVVLAAHASSGTRVLWGECRESAGGAGLHTYPDLDVVQVVDPETGEHAADGAGELVVTQLGVRGSALLRWRTADLVARIDPTPCPSCGRNVPRALGLQRHALVVTDDSGRAVDLRAVAGALSGRADVQDWRVVIGGRARDGRGQVVVHLTPNGDAGDVAVGTATDIRAVAGRLPTQLVTGDADDLARLTGTALTRRVLLRR